jgi:hypothetical protein
VPIARDIAERTGHQGIETIYTVLAHLRQAAIGAHVDVDDAEANAAHAVGPRVQLAAGVMGETTAVLIERRVGVTTPRPVGLRVRAGRRGG